MKRVILTTAAMLFCATAEAQILDFEDAAAWGGDDRIISQDYFMQHGIQISGRAGRSAQASSDVQFSFESAGKDGTDAFRDHGNSRDTALSGSLGSYFMKAGPGDEDIRNSKYFNINIDYLSPVHRTQAEIWDIDGSEQYQVTAYDANGNEIGSLTSPKGGLNGEPWMWSFRSSAGQSIASVDINYIGPGNLQGFGFDSFEAHPGPVPAALPLGLMGLGLVALRRRRSRRTQK